VPKSVLEAIKLGYWDFEPPEVSFGDFERTDSMPGTKAKLRAMAERVQSGLPLWHPDDRDEVDDPGQFLELTKAAKPR
jgi:hypothetical protein